MENNQAELVYSNKTLPGCKYVGVKNALEKAVGLTENKQPARVASLNEVIDFKNAAPTTTDVWRKLITTSTVEVYLPNPKKYFFDSELVVVIPGLDLLTPERIEKAYADNLATFNEHSTFGNAVLTPEEIELLLKGKYPNGNSLNLVTIDYVMKPNYVPNTQNGIVMPYNLAKNTKSGTFSKEEFMNNPLVIARNGGPSGLEKYFTKARGEDTKIGCYHNFNEIDPSKPQAYFLSLGGSNSGIMPQTVNGTGNFLVLGKDAPKNTTIYSSENK